MTHPKSRAVVTTVWKSCLVRRTRNLSVELTNARYPHDFIVRIYEQIGGLQSEEWEPLPDNVRRQTQNTESSQAPRCLGSCTPYADA